MRRGYLIALPTPDRLSIIRRMMRRAVVEALMMTLALPSQASLAQQRSIPVLDRSGVLPDGTPYGIVIPPQWNGTLLLDILRE